MSLVMLCFCHFFIFSSGKSIISSDEFRKRHRSIVMNNSSWYHRKKCPFDTSRMTRETMETPEEKNQFHILFPFSADQRKNYFTYKTIQAGQFFRLTFTRFIHAKCGNYCAVSQSSIPNETKGINKNTEEAFSFRPISVSRHASHTHMHSRPNAVCALAQCHIVNTEIK